MKKMMIALMTMLTIAAQVSAMSYDQARNEALFLTDKMAYELNLTDAQYEAAYEINLDYLMSITSRDDVFGYYWDNRNADLNYILSAWQWELFRAAHYFYRPLYWEAGYWHFSIYARYPHRDYFYFGRPHFYATYRGGHSWRSNGGRSYYASRGHHYRPTLPRDRHVGMRDHHNRGDYRSGGPSGHRGHSSTRVTGGRSGHDRGSAQPHNSGTAQPHNSGGSRSGGSAQPHNHGGSRSVGGVRSGGASPRGGSAPSRGGSTPSRSGGQQGHSRSHH